MFYMSVCVASVCLELCGVSWSLDAYTLGLLLLNYQFIQLATYVFCIYLLCMVIRAVSLWGQLISEKIRIIGSCVFLRGKSSVTVGSV